VSPHWSETTILLWDAALSLLFFIQHSGMARTKVRTRVASITTPIYQPAIYAISSGIVLVVVLLLWQPPAIRIFALARPWRYVAQGSSIASLLLFVWAFRSLQAGPPGRGSAGRTPGEIRSVRSVRIEFSPDALEQIRVVHDWWRIHRPGATAALSVIAVPQALCPIS
jgi:hypothetical protein